MDLVTGLTGSSGKLAGLAAELQAQQADAARLLAMLQRQAELEGEGLRPLRETGQQLNEQLAGLGEVVGRYRRRAPDGD